MPECHDDLKIKKTGKYFDNGKKAVTEKKDTSKTQKENLKDLKTCLTPDILNSNRLVTNHHIGLNKMLKLFNRNMIIRINYNENKENLKNK